MHEELDAGFAVVDGVAVVAVVTSDKAGAIGVVERTHGAAATLAPCAAAPTCLVRLPYRVWIYEREVRERTGPPWAGQI